MLILISARFYAYKLKLYVFYTNPVNAMLSYVLLISGMQIVLDTKLKCKIDYSYICLLLLLLLQPFNGLFSRTTWVSRYQKGKTKLDFTGARDSEWQWHQLGYMQVCTSLQTDNHGGTPPLCFLQAGCPSCNPTNSVKALKAHIYTHSYICLVVFNRNQWLGKPDAHKEKEYNWEKSVKQGTDLKNILRFIIRLS